MIGIPGPLGMSTDTLKRLIEEAKKRGDVNSVAMLQEFLNARNSNKPK